ncbi:MAG: FHA domain-containing protein [Fimbriimonadia bacterium]|nr:FHA domain-containing protein [Fimbriimonadia bacterium]
MEQNPTVAMDANAPQTVQMSAPAAGATQMLSPAQCPICGQVNPPGEAYCMECGFLLTSAAPEENLEPERSFPKLRDTPSGRDFLLKAGVNIIGRDPSADILLNDGTVSRRHAQILVEGNTAFVEELGSTNGSKLGGKTLSIGQRAPLANGDSLQFGNIHLTLELPEGFETPVVAESTSETALAYLIHAAQPEERWAIYARPLRLGRRDSNDIQLSDPYVSGQHAQVEIVGDRIQLTDLGSTNGTFIEGERLAPNMPAVVDPDKGFTLGQTAFRVEWATSTEDSSASEGEAETEQESVSEIAAMPDESDTRINPSPEIASQEPENDVQA